MSPLPADRALTALLRALVPVAAPFTTIAARSMPWSSATFDGARHRVALRLEGEDATARAERLCASLGEADLPMRGAFVADIVVTARLGDDPPIVALEVLTIEEAEAAPATLTRAARRAG